MKLCGMSRDSISIMLRQVENPIGLVEIWTGSGNAQRLHDECMARGARIIHPPLNQPWALETRIADLDGHVL